MMPLIYFGLRIFLVGVIALFLTATGFRLMLAMVALDFGVELQQKNPAAGLAILGIAICVGLSIGMSVGLAVYGGFSI